MKFHTISLLSCVIIASVCSTGCAENARLKSEVDALQEQNIHQSQEIARLNGQLAIAKTETASSSFYQASSDALTAAEAAWNWSTNQVSAGYHSVEAEARQCYNDQTKLGTWEDYKALAVHCWETVRK